MKAGSAYFNGFAVVFGGFVNGFYVADIEETVLAGGTSGTVFFYGEAEIVHHVGELVGLFEFKFLGRRFFAEADFGPFIGDGGFHVKPSAVADGADAALTDDAITGQPLEEDAGGELEFEEGCFFDLREAGVAGRRKDLTTDFDGFFTGEKASGVDTVNTDIGEAAAAGEFHVGAPGTGGVVGVEVKSEFTAEVFYAAKFVVPDGFDGAFVGGVEPDAIAEPYKFAGGFCGVENFLTVGFGGGEGFFAKDMFAGFKGGEAVVFVEAIGGDYVDYLDVVAVGEAFHIFEVNYGGGVYVVFLGKLAALAFGIAGDKAADGGVAAVFDVVKNGAAGKVAYAGNGPADFF